MSNEASPRAVPNREPIPSVMPLVAGAAALLNACGGGGGAAAGAGTQPDSSAAGPITVASASRFLAQAALAASDEEIARVQSLGFAGWLARSFAADASPGNWDWLLSQGFNDAANRNLVAQSDYAIWQRLITAPDELRQRIALALSEIFVVSVNGLTGPWRQFAMAAYWDTLVANAFGNFRTLLEAVTLNPAMGIYLNTKGNQKEDAATGRAPDENYAREVMQLFTIGLVELNADGTTKQSADGQPVETYDQNAISHLARVFTGWDLDPAATSAAAPTQFQLPMTLNAARHSSLPVQFLGTTMAAGTDGRVALRTALDTLFRHANVGPFIGRQLIQRLVTSNPGAAYVGRVAAAFNDNGSGVRGDLQAVIRAVLLDSDARGDAALTQASGGKLREPILRFIQWARTFKATSASGAWRIPDLSDPATRLGQSPLRAPSVFNFFRPGYTPPNTALAGSGLVAPEFQLTNESTVAGYLNFMQTVISNGIADVKADYASEMALAGDPAALVGRLNLLLAAGQLSAATQSSISTAVASISASTATGQLNRVRAAIMLVMACPEYLVQK